jgi:coenzyme F420 hydrogenase subunit beta
MIDLKVLSEVVAGNICTECGACAGICPTDALPMRETRGGQVLPDLVEAKCIECGLCDMVCPQIELSDRYAELVHGPLKGPVVGSYLAQTTDPLIEREAQAGGLGRSLVAWCMDKGIVDAAVVVVDDPDEPMRPKAVLTRDPAVVLGSSRSKYCPIPVNDLILEMMRFDGRIAFIGLSCHMQGLQLAIERIGKLKKKVVLRLGLFCDRVLTYQAPEFYARCAGVRPGERITYFDYRNKEKNGWYGEYRVKTDSGRDLSAPRTIKAGSRALFTPLHCWLCPDKANVLSDVSIGDPHGVASGRSVPSAVLVRTAFGEEVMRGAELDGRIRRTPVDAARLVKGQNLEHNAWMAEVVGRAVARKGGLLPVILREGKAAQPGPLPVWARLAAWWSVESQTETGIRLLGHLPTWEPAAWLWIRQGPVKQWKRGVMVLRRLATTGRLRGSNRPNH